MPCLDPKVVVLEFAVHRSLWPVKQTQRHFRPELVPEIQKEVDKLIAANFIWEVKYPSWIANIVLVKNKSGQIWVYVDFHNLKKDCPKDDFPLPITELMVDATTEHEVLSFIDGSSVYNQIRMDPKDEELTGFHMPKGIFCYKVMPFGLKNADTTYQRVMQHIFENFLHKHIECYVDDLVVKRKKQANHLLDLRAVFERLRRFQLKMNPLKCTFGVTSSKSFGFVVHHRGIEIDQTKINTIKRCQSRETSRNSKASKVIWPIFDDSSRTWSDDVNHSADDLLSYSLVLTQNCSNNVVEYQPLLGLGMAVKMEITQLEVYNDSSLMIKHITGEFEDKKIELVTFRKHASDLLAKILQASLHCIPRTKNRPADALAGIVASLAQLDNRPSQVPMYERRVVPLVPLPIEEEAEEEMEEKESLPISIRENEARNWRKQISNFF
ncbi:hypothetical protein H6P81_002847 [Aristolochia fimbriata]|uniref:Reverse transcriptase domain-containing protein n=1 Tax=Aristolochia fimbriata TaxID=158543 RepID=A0AAV7FBH5_ARIFI|nr:hypothetical protein H6P81_002847 [Aristolochia fimbriata]